MNPPISLTNILNKILERIIFNKILHHLESINFFQGKNLHAYRRFSNTTHILLLLIEDMCDSISNGRIGASIMADLEGALPHGEKVLCTKYMIVGSQVISLLLSIVI